MVVVKIEIHPCGDATRARQIGEVRIANDGTGTAEFGNYDVELLHSGAWWGTPGVYRRGKVLRFARNLSPYHLLARALKACKVF